MDLKYATPKNDTLENVVLDFAIKTQLGPLPEALPGKPHGELHDTGTTAGKSPCIEAF